MCAIQHNVIYRVCHNVEHVIGAASNVFIMIRTVDATDMYYCRDHVDCVCLCRLMFVGRYSSIYRVNVDGTGQREIVSGLSMFVIGLSLDHNNHVCWDGYRSGKTGKGQRIVLSLELIK